MLTQLTKGDMRMSNGLWFDKIGSKDVMQLFQPCYKGWLIGTPNRSFMFRLETLK